MPLVQPVKISILISKCYVRNLMEDHIRKWYDHEMGNQGNSILKICLRLPLFIKSIRKDVVSLIEEYKSHLLVWNSRNGDVSNLLKWDYKNVITYWGTRLYYKKEWNWFNRTLVIFVRFNDSLKFVNKCYILQSMHKVF